MKTKYLLLMGLLIISLNARVHAEDVALNVTGVLHDSTCSVSPDSQSKLVNLGNIPLRQFTQAGDISSLAPFSIELEKCGTAVGNVSITFSGTTDTTNPQLLATDAGEGKSSGVGVAIFDHEHKLLPLGSAGDTFDLNGQSTASLQFYAAYMATQKTVMPGSAEATATFVVNYA